MSYDTGFGSVMEVMTMLTLKITDLILEICETPKRRLSVLECLPFDDTISLPPDSQMLQVNQSV